MSPANPAPVDPASDMPNPVVGRTLNVHFSDPSPWARFAARPKSHWKLVGRGEMSLSPEKLILRGRRPRFLWTAAGPDIEISLSDIINVTQANNLVQCHVRFANSTDKVLQLWVQDEAAARQITELLPKQKTPEFERVAVEQAAFNSALEALQTRSIVTSTLVAANCFIFACTVFAGAGLLQPDGALLIQWGTNFGPLTLQGEWWRLFTSMFLHFGLIHLLLNMWALLSLGRLTERLYGSVHFALLYVFAGLFGSIASLLWRSGVNSAGASGAIFGVIGGLLAFMVNPKTQIPTSVATAQRNSALVFVGYNLINGFAHAGIDNACHIGGLVGGFAMGWLLARPLDSKHREDSGPQFAVASFMGVIALIGLSWPLVHPSRVKDAEWQFRSQLQSFAVEEQRILAAQRTLDELERSKQITHPEWGRRLAKDILPRWEAAEDRLSAGQLPEQSPLYPVKTGLISYLDQKRFGLDLLSDAARSNDPDKLEWGNQVLNRNEQQMRALDSLIRNRLR